MERLGTILRTACMICINLIPRDYVLRAIHGPITLSMDHTGYYIVHQTKTTQRVGKTSIKPLHTLFATYCLDESVSEFVDGSEV